MTDRPNIPEEAVEAVAAFRWGPAWKGLLPGRETPAREKAKERKEADERKKLADIRAELESAAPALRKQGAEEERRKLLAEGRPTSDWVKLVERAEKAGDALAETLADRDAAYKAEEVADRERDQALAKGAEEELERLLAKLESKEARKAGEDVLREAAAARPAWAGAVIAAVVNTVLPAPSEPREER